MKITDEDKEMIRDIINREGTILEESTANILQKVSPQGYIIRNCTFPFGKEWHQVDVMFTQSDDSHQREYIMECKNSSSVWIFPHNEEEDEKLHLCTQIRTKSFKVLSLPNMKIKTVVGDNILLCENGEFVYKKKNSEEKNSLKTIKQHQEDVWKYCMQVIGQLEAYISIEPIERTRVFYPIIVTNAELFCAEYNSSQISTEGQLLGINLKPADWLAYLHPHFLKKWNWNINPTGGNSEVIKNDFGLITVFIVNVKKLKEFLEYISNTENLPDLIKRHQ